MGFVPCCYLNIFLMKLKLGPFCTIFFHLPGSVFLFPFLNSAVRIIDVEALSGHHNEASSHALAPSSRALAPFAGTAEKRDGKIKEKYLNVKARVSVCRSWRAKHLPMKSCSKRLLPSAIFDEALIWTPAVFSLTGLSVLSSSQVSARPFFLFFFFLFDSMWVHLPLPLLLWRHD